MKNTVNAVHVKQYLEFKIPELSKELLEIVRAIGEAKYQHSQRSCIYKFFVEPDFSFMNWDRNMKAKILQEYVDDLNQVNYNLKNGNLMIHWTLQTSEVGFYNWAAIYIK